MEIDSLEKLFTLLLSDIYFAEKRLDSLLPQAMNKAESKALKKELEKYLLNTKEQIARLNLIFKLLRETPEKDDLLSTMDPFFEKMRGFLGSQMSSQPMDALMITLILRMTHYEITTYAVLKEYASALGYRQIEEMLEETFREERKLDEHLMRLGESGIFSSASLAMR